ncbi:MAG: sulfotransferase [Rubritepida sp.]|nr:sulfotransferase [Rubritepida sp.]
MSEAPMPVLHPVAIPVPGRAPMVFEVAEAGPGPFFSLGVRKSGSTLLHRIMGVLARRNGLHVVDVPGAFFQQGMTVADWMRCDLGPLLRPGNLHAGFRSFPGNIAQHPAFLAARKVFMHRDPRDALVSQYFSDAFSHGLPAAGAEAFERKRAAAQATALETFVLEKARNLDRVLMACRPLLEDPNCLVLRYEEAVLAKRDMLARILAHFGWEFAPAEFEALLAEVDEIPTEEDPRRFVRRVVPGDHREKLSPETIARLETGLAASMRAFGYA